MRPRSTAASTVAQCGRRTCPTAIRLRRRVRGEQADGGGRWRLGRGRRRARAGPRASPRRGGRRGPRGGSRHRAVAGPVPSGARRARRGAPHPRDHRHGERRETVADAATHADPSARARAGATRRARPPGGADRAARGAGRRRRADRSGADAGRGVARTPASGVAHCVGRPAAARTPGARAGSDGSRPRHGDDRTDAVAPRGHSVGAARAQRPQRVEQRVGTAAASQRLRAARPRRDADRDRGRPRAPPRPRAAQAPTPAPSRSRSSSPTASTSAVARGPSGSSRRTPTSAARSRGEHDRSRRVRRARHPASTPPCARPAPCSATSASSTAMPTASTCPARSGPPSRAAAPGHRVDGHAGGSGPPRPARHRCAPAAPASAPARHASASRARRTSWASTASTASTPVRSTVGSGLGGGRRPWSWAQGRRDRRASAARRPQDAGCEPAPASPRSGHDRRRRRSWSGPGSPASPPRDTSSRPVARCVVLEAADAVGGRVRSERIDGVTVDRGFQLLNPAYPEARRVLDLPAPGTAPVHRGPPARRRARRGPRLSPIPVATHRAVVDRARHPGHARSSRRGSRRTPSAWPPPIRADPRSRPTTRSAPPAPRSAGSPTSVLAPFLAGVLFDDSMTTSRRFADLLLRSFVRGTPAVPARRHAGDPRPARRRARRRASGRRCTEVTPTTVRTDDGTMTARAVVVATDPPAAGTPAARPRRAGHALGHDLVAPRRRPRRMRSPGARPILVVDPERRGPLVNSVVVSNAAPSYATGGRALVASTALGTGHADEPRCARTSPCCTASTPPAWQTVAVHALAATVPAIAGRIAAAPPGEPRRCLRRRRPPRHRVDPGRAGQRTSRRRGRAAPARVRVEDPAPRGARAPRFVR